MKISILDLGHKVKDVLYALEHNESIVIYHNGKEKGVMYSKRMFELKKMKVNEHPSFGMWKADKKTKNVSKYMYEARKPSFSRFIF